MNTTRAHGPLFDGRAAAAVEAFLNAAKDDIAQEGVNLVQRRLGQVLKNPTGFYESRITTERRSDDRAVTDSGVVYGPWLEGVGSRNQSSRFKGYRTFRETTQELQAAAPDIAEGLLRQFTGRMQ